jgi:hypothetical protein
MRGHPEDFGWDDKTRGKRVLKEGLKTQILKTQKPGSLPLKYCRLVKDYQGQLLGHGDCSLCFDIGKEKVLYFTSDYLKYEYLGPRGLDIMDEGSYASFNMVSWNKDGCLPIFAFKAKRLYKLSEIEDQSKLEDLKIKMAAFAGLFRLIAKFKKNGRHELFYLADNRFGEIRKKTIKKNSAWSDALKILHHWSHREGFIFQKLAAAIKGRNILVDKNGELAYITFPGKTKRLAYLDATPYHPEPDSRILTPEQGNRYIDLFSTYLAGCGAGRKGMGLRTLEEKISELSKIFEPNIRIITREAKDKAIAEAFSRSRQG